MSALEPLPRPDACPERIDWDNLTPVTQHGLMARLNQLGRIELNDPEVEFVARILRPVRRSA